MALDPAASAGLSLEIVLAHEKIAHCIWSRVPFRHCELAITVTNGDDHVFDGVSFELLVPEDAIFNLSGDAWNPMYKREVDGNMYDTWQTLGGGGPGAGRYRTRSGGQALITQWREKLAVNLKPESDDVELLWRLFVRAEPVGEYGRTTLSFTHVGGSPF